MSTNQGEYTLINGVLYDISKFKTVHPGGNSLLSIAKGRDASILFESYHINDQKVLNVLNTLPKITNFTEKDLKEGKKYGKFDLIPSLNTSFEQYPSPNTSTLYKNIKKRVKNEIIIPANKKRGRGGTVIYDALIVVLFWLLTSYYYIKSPNILSGILLGLAGAWIGFGVQHTANHGGLFDSYKLNAFFGWLDDIACGGSSLIWRYHHHVSHHIYTNDCLKDQDVYSSFPLLRLDITQDRFWYNQYQHIYGPFMFMLLYFSVQIQDFLCFFNKKSYHIHLLGLSRIEMIEFWLGKLIHFACYLILPLYLHPYQLVLKGFLAFSLIGSLTLSILFIVSHNILETKPIYHTNKSNDWAIWQIETSASWGGKIASFFTGGLNYQIEHHLFPSIAHNHYYDISKIIKEECHKNNVKYKSYSNIWLITKEMIRFLYVLGNQDQPNYKVKLN